jgi:hypothetical protein
MFNATFNNFSVVSWRSVLLVEETRVKDKQKQRRSAISSSSESSVYVSAEQIEKVKKLHSLERTLKVSISLY